VVDSVTAGIIITSISYKTTKAQIHRDSRTSNRAIGFLCILVNCFVKDTNTNCGRFEENIFVCKIKKFVSKL
jgi:hypothetical protein